MQTDFELDDQRSAINLHGIHDLEQLSLAPRPPAIRFDRIDRQLIAALYVSSICLLRSILLVKFCLPSRVTARADSQPARSCRHRSGRIERKEGYFVGASVLCQFSSSFSTPRRVNFETLTRPTGRRVLARKAKDMMRSREGKRRKE